MFLGVSLHCLFSMSSAVNNMGPRRMSMVCRLLVTSGLVVFGRFPVVAGGMGQMFCCLSVMFSCFLRHGVLLHSVVLRMCVGATYETQNYNACSAISYRRVTEADVSNNNRYQRRDELAPSHSITSSTRIPRVLI